MAGSWISVNGEDLYEVEKLTDVGLYSRYSAGSGQGVAVNISNLRENLSQGEVLSLSNRLNQENLDPGTHTVSYNNLAAVFRGEEAETIGGFRADVTVTVSVDDQGDITILGGSWSQSLAEPVDEYNFSPIWAPHRSLSGNIATTAQHIFDAVFPPYTPSKPFNIAIIGQRELEITDNGAISSSQCFKSDTMINMWPNHPSIEPRSDGSYDEDRVLSLAWQKHISEVKVGDLVLSYDKQGRLQPGPVLRTMTSTSTHIIDFWGTGVTPGHSCYCADGPFRGEHLPLMDILRTDTAMMRADGKKFRSTTNCEVGSIGDRMIHAEASVLNSDGTWTSKKRGQVRFGTRISTPDGKKSISFMEIAKRQGWSLSDDGYMVGKIEGEDGSVQESKFPFPYTHGAELPKPEDYILTRSQVTLEYIYLANEWEQIGTRMPAPESMNDL
ncbi:MAG: hypothetical protein AAFQ87_24125, partial [Bacteroidota bacterium]